MAEYGFITLSECADKACTAIEDYEQKLKLRFLDFGFDYLDKLKIVNSNEVKTVLLPMNNIHFVPFPRDFIRFTKIGTIEGGKVRLFTVNDRIALHHKFECGNYIDNPPLSNPNLDSVDNIPYQFYNYTNSYGVRKPIFGYGLGVDNNRDVRVDYENRGLQFSPNVDSQEIYLEYISSGFTPNEDTFIPVIAQRACRDYMLRQHYNFKGDVKNFQLMDAEYTIERRNITKAFRGLSVQDVVQYSMRAFKQSIKTGL